MIAWLAKEALVGRDAPLFTGPVMVNLVFDFGKQPKTVIEVKPIFPVSECMDKRPDLSNCIKLVEDALIGIVFKDDSQVCRLEAVKVTRHRD